jgi:hypothetical protein
MKHGFSAAILAFALTGLVMGAAGGWVGVELANHTHGGCYR